MTEAQEKKFAELMERYQIPDEYVYLCRMCAEGMIRERKEKGSDHEG